MQRKIGDGAPRNLEDTLSVQPFEIRVADSILVQSENLEKDENPSEIMS